MRQRGLAKITALVAIVLLGAVTAALAWSFASETGSRWLLTQAQRWVPGELRIDAVEGRFVDALRLRGVSYRYQDWYVQAAALHLVWQTGQAGIHIKRLHAEALQVHIPQFKDRPLPLPDIDLPFPVRVDELRLAPVTLIYADRSPVILASVAAQASLTDTLSLTSLRVHSPSFSIHAAGRMALHGPHELALDLDWSGTIAVPDQDDIHLDGRGVVQGNPNYLTFKNELIQPVALNMQVTLRDLLKGSSNHRWALQLAWDQLPWPLPAGENRATQWVSREAHLTAQGRWSGYQLAFATQLSGVHLPASRWTLEGAGDVNQLTLERLSGELLQGRLQAHGHVNWQVGVQASLEAAAEGFALTELWPQWPADVNIDAQLLAKLDDQKLTLEQLAVSLPATGAALALQGDADIGQTTPRFALRGSWRGLQWPLQGDNPRASTQGRLAVVGALDDYQLDFTGSLRGSEIPQGQWRATGQGDAKGLHIDTLQGEVLAGTVTGQGHLRWQPTLTWQMTITGEGLNPAEHWQAWPGELALTLESQGRRQDGIVRARIDGPQLDGQLRGNPLRLQTQMQLQQDRWQLDNFDLSAGSARLQARASLADSLTGAWRITVPDLAALLPAAQGSLTGAGQISGTLAQPVVTASLDGRELVIDGQRLQRLQARIEPHPGDEGSLRAAVELEDWRHGERQFVKRLDLSGAGDLEQHRISAQLAAPEGQLTLGLNGGFVDGRALAWEGELQRLTAASTSLGDWSLQNPVSLNASPAAVNLPLSCLQNRREAGGEICVRADWQPDATQPLRGQLRLADIALAALPTPQLPLENLQGTLDAQMDFAGVVSEPHLQGYVKVHDGAGKLPDLNVHLEDFELTALANGSRTVRLQAQVASGDGWATLQGNLDLTSFPQWRLQAGLEGEAVEIVNSPTLWLLASPAMQVSAGPDGLDLQGELVIPEGKVAPVISRFTKDAVSVSEDTVIVNSSPEQPMRAKDQPLKNLSAQLKVVVAPPVTLQLADFHSNLHGSGVITKEVGEKAIGEGGLQLTNGQYKAYGQNLRVNHGQIFFADEPIDNPSLDIKATRQIYGDKPVNLVGVHITGWLQSPQFSLFSEPPLERQSDILSYLTLGDALDLDDDETDNMSLGIYLLPNFYISYGLDRVEDSKIYSMRYELGERFWVEGEFVEGKFNEDQQGIDFSYTLER